MSRARSFGSFDTSAIGECDGPVNPPVPGSPQVRLPVGYISDTFAGIPRQDCALDAGDPRAERRPPARG